MGVRTIVCGQPDKARQPLTHPQLAMMHFVYEIRVTLSTKILMFSGLATTLLAHGTR
jgi:hypothetical protein